MRTGNENMKQILALAVAWMAAGSVAFCQTPPDTSHYGEGGDTRAIRLCFSYKNPATFRALGDINGDGYSDLFFRQGYSNYLVLGRSGTESGCEKSPPYIQLQPDVYGVSPAGDVNGDGISDIFVQTLAGNRYLYYLILGSKNAPLFSSGDFSNSPRILLPDSPSILGDVDGDGSDELALKGNFIDRGGNYGDYPIPQQIDRGFFIETYALPACHYVFFASRQGSADYLYGVGDITGSGTDAIALYHKENYHDPIYFDDYSISYAAEFTGYPASLFNNLSEQNVRRVYAVSACEFPSGGPLIPGGDVNGSGLASYFIDDNYIRKVGAAIDSQEVVITAFPSYENLSLLGASCDVDGDGYADMVVSRRSSNSLASYVLHGSPELASASIDSPIFHTQALASTVATPIGDFNGDGYIDFIGSFVDSTYITNVFIQLGNKVGFHSSGVYRSYAKAGAAPLRGVGEGPGGATYPPDARTWLGFADGDGPSLQAVTLHRNLDGVSNIPPNMKAANVHWGITSERANYTQANLSLKYVDREISGLNEDSLYLLESSTGPAGPWYLVENAEFEKDRDTVHFHTANLGDYVIAEYTPAGSTGYTFNQSGEDWTFAAPLRPDLATGDRDTTAGAMAVTIGQGTNSFAFYEGPLTAIANTSEPALYRMSYRVFTDQPDRLMNPQIRFRASLEDFEQTQELVAPSVDVLKGRDAFGPSLQGTDYEQYFLAPPNQSHLRMDFDVIATDPGDAATATLSLDSARLEPFPIATQPVVVMYYDFRNSNANGFTLAAPHPTMTPAGFDAAATADGLSLRANASDSTPRLAFQFFGKTEGALRFKGEHLYRADFTIASHATSANAHALPGFRLRVNSESFQFATLLHVEPHVAQQPLPTEGAPQTYSLYFKAPAAIDGEQAIFSFDYLTTPEAQADSTQAIVLQQLAVAEY
ncbi:hypothetical protein BH09SUM1_BH09SUM1_06740 [soil metagenome]